MKTARIVALIIVASIVLSTAGVGLYVLLAHKDPVAPEVTQYNTLVGKFTDREIVNADSAILAVKDVAEDLGFTNAVEELTPQSTNTVDNLTYYRLRQNYQGIPVYGSSLVVVSDENGEARGLTGNASDIEEDISLAPTVTQAEVESSIRAYLEKNAAGGIVPIESIGKAEEKTAAEITVPALSSDLLVIYNYSDVEEAMLAYELYITVDNEPYKTVIGAQNAQVLLCYNLLTTETVTATAKDSDGNTRSGFNVSKTTSGAYTTYTLLDEKRNIRLINANNGTLTYDLYYRGSPDNYQSYFAEFYTTAAEGITNVTCTDNQWTNMGRAIKIYNNAQITYDFFLEVLNSKGVDNDTPNCLVTVCFNDYNRGDTTNAYSWGYSAYKMNEVLLSFGTDNSLGLDTMGHEYTHSVERRISLMDYEGISGAIMEGISDIFGELVEDWANDGLDGDCNWLHFDRNMISPSSSQNIVCSYALRGETCPVYAREGTHYYNRSYTVTNDCCCVRVGLPETIYDPSFVSPDSNYDYGGVHWNSTIVSHIAYLMVSEYGITTEELAHLWYNTLYTLPANCSFDTLLKNMKMVADSMGYSDTKIAAIESAFARAGISSESSGTMIVETHGIHPTVQVYGTDMKLCDNYVIDILEIGMSNPKKDHIVVTNTAPVSLKMPVGVYNVTVSDRNNPDKTVTKRIIISAHSDDTTIAFATSFGRVDVHTHSYTEFETPASCVREGYRKKVCSCGDEILLATFPVTDHSYTRSTVPPTCIREGAENAVCSACGDSITTPIPKIDHVYADGKCTMCGQAQPTCGTPTVTTPNNTKVTQGNGITITWNAPTVPASGITYYIAVMEAGKDSTYALLNTEAITALSYAIDAKHLSKATTYVVILYAKADGYRQSETSVNIIVEEAVCTHTSVKDPAVAATCTKTGLTEGTHCSRCGAVLIAQTATPTIPHSYVSGKCTMCGQAQPACGLPTITAGDVYEDGSLRLTWTAPTVPASGVTYFIAVMEAGKESTTYTEVTPRWISETTYTVSASYFTTEGTYIVTLYAKADGYLQSQVSVNVEVVIEHHAHTPVKDPAVAATCTKTGLTEGSHCATCGEVLTKQSVVPTIPHNYVSGVCTMCGQAQAVCGFPTITRVEVNASDNSILVCWIPPTAPASGVTYFIAIMEAGKESTTYVEVTPRWISDTSYTIDSSYFKTVGTYIVALYAKADGYRTAEVTFEIEVKVVHTS